MPAGLVSTVSIPAGSIGEIYDVDPASVQHYPVPALKVLKISYPRRGSQGGVDDGLTVLADVLPHLLRQVRGTTDHEHGAHQSHPHPVHEEHHRRAEGS